MMRLFKTLPLAATFLASFTLHAVELRPANDGLKVEAGTLGSFTLAYPALHDVASKPVHKLIEAKTDGANTVVRYEGGGEVVILCVGDDIHFSFANMPDDVKSWRVEMLIDISFGKGGTWKIGDKSGSFPASKPEKPHLHQESVSTFEIKNAQGQSLRLTLPDYAFQQLTDNREWNWPIYHWMAVVPFAPDKTEAVIRVATELKASAKLVDAFGQSIKDNYPGKVKSADELKADIAADEKYYASFTTPTLDEFGGLPGSGAQLGLQKTGFFHVEQHEGKSWLVDPAGNAFFHFGICGFAPGDDYTYIKGREDIYEWLPKAGDEFASAFREGDRSNFSFHLANTIRKFGEPYNYDTHAARMIARVRKWGFNSIGAFSPVPATAHVKASFPYVTTLPTADWLGVPRLPGAFEVWDPFDEATRAKIEGNIAKEVPQRANDPLLIGWFIVNEPRYDQLAQAIPSLPKKHAAKRRFVQSLREQYKDIAAYNTAWQSDAKNFDELEDKGLAVKTDAAREDVNRFIGVFLEEYFTHIEAAFRKADKNHLLLGSRLQPITIENEQLCRIMGRHVDVVSYNYYTMGVDTAALKRFHEWCGGKPMMLSEFFWSSPRDSGLIGGREVSSQRERGLAYRNYVEQSAALGFVVGIEWFTLVDQSVTGRWFSQYSGESANTGLISVTDRPWKDAVEEMAKTNHTIYDVLLGKRAPFAWDDARVKMK